MILLIDNYDSFTYNLYQLLSVLGAHVEVRRNDAITADEIAALRPRGIVISPGPGDPSAAGISCEIITRFAGDVPILGVCLGHQCLGAAFGARIVRSPELMHGKTSMVYHRGQGVFAGLPNPFEAVRYHSLSVDPEQVPDSLEVTGETADGAIMGLRHREFDLEGVQFHPESVLTREGPALVGNFLARCGLGEPAATGAPGS
jgi:anthranilate synthase/aminodeoxychorismate synthase-like glutamine amidotransferase